MTLAMNKNGGALRQKFVVRIANFVDGSAADDAGAGSNANATTDSARRGANWKREARLKKEQI